MLEDQLAILHGLWGEPDGWSFEGLTGDQDRGRPVSPAPRRRAGQAVDRGGRQAAADHRRERRLATLVSARRAICGRIQPQLGLTGPGDRGQGEARRGVPGDRPRSGDATRSTMAGVLVGRRTMRSSARERTLLAAFGNDAETGEAWLEERRLRWVYGTPDQARAPGATVRGGRHRTDHVPGLHPLGPRHGRRHRRGDHRAVLNAGMSRLATISPRRRRRPRGTGRHRDGSRPGPTPRARAIRSVSELEGCGRPEQRRDRGGECRRLRDDDPPGGRQLRRQVDGGVGGDDGRRLQPDRPEPPEAPRSPAGAVRRGLSIGEDQDEPRSLIRRREVAVQERLEVAVRRRDPRPFLDLQDQFAARRPVRTGRDDHERSSLGQATGDGFGHVARSTPAGDQ